MALRFTGEGRHVQQGSPLPQGSRGCWVLEEVVAVLRDFSRCHPTRWHLSRNIGEILDESKLWTLKNETIKYSKLSFFSDFPLSCLQSQGMLHPTTRVTFTGLSASSTSVLTGGSMLSPILNSCQPQAGTYTCTEASGRLFCLCLTLLALPRGKGVMDPIGQM